MSKARSDSRTFQPFTPDLGSFEIRLENLIDDLEELEQSNEQAEFLKGRADEAFEEATPFFRKAEQAEESAEEAEWRVEAEKQTAVSLPYARWALAVSLLADVARAGGQVVSSEGVLYLGWPDWNSSNEQVRNDAKESLQRALATLRDEMDEKKSPVQEKVLAVLGRVKKNKDVVAILRDADIRLYACREEKEIKVCEHQTEELRVVPITLVRCGTPTIREIFQPEVDPPVRDPGVIAEDDEDSDGDIPVDNADVIVEDDEDSDVAVAVDSADDDAIAYDDDLTPDDNSVLDEDDEEPSTVTKATIELIGQLEAACRARRFQIEDVDLSLVKEGPTLVSVPVGYAVGAPLSVVERATEDIARDIGVGKDVEVVNDLEHAGHIRFLLPKTDRKFPLIPTVKTPSYDADGNGKYLGIWLGAQVDGTPYRSFVSEWPHLLLGGTTGSGKTTFLRSILGQLNEAPDKNVTIAIIDGKGDFDYDGVIDDDRFPKKDEFRDVLIGAESVLPVMEWLVNEEINERRQKIRAYLEKHKNAGRSPKRAYVRSMNKHGVRKLGETGTTKFPISPIIIVIDEFAQLMTTTGPDARQFANLVQQVVQMGRSALVHLLLATQRPDATVVPGTIKANLPSRIGMKLPSHQDSSVILGETGAEKLLGLGDLIFKSAAGERIRLQGFNLAEEE